MTSPALAVTTDRRIEPVAQEFLSAHGSAIGAVLAAYFTAIGLDAGVLMSPMSVVTGAVTSGARTFDGRPRQPGMGVKRPRGFRAREIVPDAAFVAAPTGVHAALVALAYDTVCPLSRVVRAALASLSKDRDSPRGRLLQRIGQVGASALSESGFAHPLLAVAGPSEGGVLTPSDLGSVPDVDHAAVALGGADTLRNALIQRGSSSDEVVLGAPLAEGSKASGRFELALAVDARGGFAALGYASAETGIAIDEIGVVAPRVAVPVMRGVPRVTPGAFLGEPAPLGIHTDSAGSPVAVSGGVVDRANGRLGVWSLRRLPGARRVEVIRG